MGAVQVRIVGNSSASVVEVIVDTGFSAFLALPLDAIKRLGLQSQGVLQVILADGSNVDGSNVEADTFSAQVEFDGKLRDVYVVHTETKPLLGMSFLEGCQLQIEVRDGGNVRVDML